MRLIAIILLLAASALGQYTSIPGIPDPPFGVTEAVPSEPSPWNSSTTGWYYVDGVNGNDANGNGYPGAARRTVPSGVPAGSVIKIYGSLAFTGQTAWNFPNCTQGQPCFVRCENETGIAPSGATQQQLNFGGSYTIIQGCALNKIFIRFGITGSDANNLVLRQNSLTGIGGSGAVIGFNPPGVNGHLNHVIYNNTIHDNNCVSTPCALGDGNPATIPGDMHGIKAGQGQKVEKLWIIDNTSYRNMGDSFQIGTATTRAVNADDPQYVFIGRNTCYDDYENCIDIKTASDIIISSNTMSQYYEEGPTDGGQGHGEAIVTHNKAARIWTLFNTIHTARTGVYYQDQSDEGWVIGNVFYNIEHDTTPGNGIDDTYDANVLSTAAGTGSAVRFGTLDAALAPAGAKYYAYHNTIVDADRGIISTMGATQSCVIRDNIVRNLKLNGPNFGWNVAASHTSSTVSHNVTEFEDTSNVLFQVGTTRYETHNEYTTAFGDKCSGCSSADPQFVNLNGRNYTLQETSPVIAAGSGDLSPYDRFDELYSTALFGGATGLIRKDRLGNARSSGTLWDIGAYEYTVGGPPPTNNTSPTLRNGTFRNGTLR